LYIETQVLTTVLLLFKITFLCSLLLSSVDIAYWGQVPGRPRKSWKSSIKEDLTLLGLTWDEAKEEVEDREKWRCHVARCATRARGRTKV